MSVPARISRKGKGKLFSKTHVEANEKTHGFHNSRTKIILPSTMDKELLFSSPRSKQHGTVKSGKIQRQEEAEKKDTQHP